MKNYISLQEIIECNHSLEEKDFHVRIHLRDACGKQSMWMESLNESDLKEKKEEIYRYLDGFFKDKGYTISYSKDKLNFWVE